MFVRKNQGSDARRYRATGALSGINAYVFAILIVISASLFRQSLEPTGFQGPYATFYLAIVLASVVAGVAAGLVTTAISAFIGTFFFLGSRPDFVMDMPAMIGLGFFMLNGLAISIISGAMHRQLFELEFTRNRLQNQVERSTTSLRRVESLQADLFQLGNAVRSLRDSAEILEVVCRELAVRMKAGRVGLGERQGDPKTLRVTGDFGSYLPSVKDKTLSDYCSESHLAQLSRGSTAVRHAIDEQSGRKTADDSILEPLGVASALDVPLSKNGNMIAVLFIHFAQPHDFTDGEIDLATEATKLLWNALLRARAEEELKARTTELTALLENAPLGMAYFDREKRIVRVNDALAEMNGVPANSYIGRKFDEVIARESRPVDAIISRVFETGKTESNVEIRGEWPRESGSERFLLTGYYPVYGMDRTVEFVGVWIVDISERKRAEKRQQLMINELNHRVKNSLAMVQSMATQTMRNSPNLEEARQRFLARLIALSDAHNILTRESWESAELMEIIEQGIAPFGGVSQGRFSIAGPPLRVVSQYALSLALILHELATNAVKFGALSKDSGKVNISWKTGESPEPSVTIDWVETGGPAVKPPVRHGFGTRLIERSLASDQGGSVRLTYPVEGVRCTITAPLRLSNSYKVDWSKTGRPSVVRVEKVNHAANKT